ncbi:ATP-binding protein [Neobacillus sp. LXY-1]|uniref:ATP-binding protein n=1 Tax=Neobacillus sp. LXY-1 TaxID=3379133 RepID=UPI003EE0A899
MKKWGQLTLVLLSVSFTAYQTLTGEDSFFTIDFFMFTVIAWFVGWQYDRARFFEKKARLSEESYKRLLDTLPEAVFIHRENKIIYANMATVKQLSRSSIEELIGESILDHLDAAYQERYLERMKQVKKEQLPLCAIEYKVKRRDGSKFVFETSSIRILFGGEEAVLTVGKDITEKKEETERLLQKSEKLALLGQMAAGIAHEIRNPLTSIKGFIQLFKHNQLKKEYYDIVLTELDRINTIVGEFLVLAKPSAVVFVERNIKDIILDVVTLINTQSILNNVQIFAEFDQKLPNVCCEENQLKQVFLNLLKNAIEAMPKGGDIHIKVQEKEEGSIFIQIIDQGVGIPQDRISTLGEPFYTTKEKGTGLGLMTCFKIVESHHGVLNINSVENVGTTIEVILPTVTQPYLKKEVHYC